MEFVFIGSEAFRAGARPLKLTYYGQRFEATEEEAAHLQSQHVPMLQAAQFDAIFHPEADAKLITDHPSPKHQQSAPPEWHEKHQAALIQLYSPEAPAAPELQDE